MYLYKHIWTKCLIYQKYAHLFRCNVDFVQNLASQTMSHSALGLIPTCHTTHFLDSNFSNQAFASQCQKCIANHRQLQSIFTQFPATTPTPNLDWSSWHTDNRAAGSSPIGAGCINSCADWLIAAPHQTNYLLNLTKSWEIYHQWIRTYLADYIMSFWASYWSSKLIRHCMPPQEIKSLFKTDTVQTSSRRSRS